jgi:organic hydroperoxide reductase OsmC/OhrA
MTEYSVQVVWKRDDQGFLDNRYSRAHRWIFDGGLDVPASSSPHIVPLPWSDARAVDPEEAFVASLSSCHMLWFLSLAAAKGFQVDRYEDQPRGIMARNAEGRLAMTEVELRPRATFGGQHQPRTEQLLALHHKAHDECFIANSVKSEVRCNPVID